MSLCTNIKSEFEPQVKVANGNLIVPKIQATVDLAPEHSPEVQHGYIFDNLATESLISIGQLYNDNFVALFSKYNLTILTNNKVIIKGWCNENGLWSIPLGKSNPLSQKYHLFYKPIESSNWIR